MERNLKLGHIVSFDVEENKQFDWSDLTEGNTQVLKKFYPGKVETVERISGVQTFLVNGFDYIFVGDDHLARLGYKTKKGKTVA